MRSSHLTDKYRYLRFTRAKKGGEGLTREQKRRAREELRACGQGKSSWAGVIALAMDYYEAEDPVCRRLLQLRYLDGMPEERVVAKLHIGRTTYYHKELEALSTVAVYAAAAGLM